MSLTCGVKTRILAFLLVIGAIVALLATMAIPPRASAAEDSADSIRVGYYENEVFQEGAQEGAVKTGYAYEYYRKLSEYTGWKYEYVYGDYSALYQKLLDGDIDLLAGLAWREDRVGLIGYPDASMGNEVYSLVKHGADKSIDSNPATLSGKKIGVLDSALVGMLNEYLDKNSVKAEVVTFDGYEKLFAAFDNQEVDVLAAEGDGAYGRSDAEVIGSLGSSDYFLCVNVKRPDLLAKLNEAQEHHYSYVNRVTYIGVPSTIVNTAWVGGVTEALTAKSREVMIPDYYDVALSERFMRDEGSKRMIEYIFGHTVYDQLVSTLCWDTTFGAFTSMVKSRSNMVTHVTAKYGNGINNMIQKAADAYEELADEYE